MSEAAAPAQAAPEAPAAPSLMDAIGAHNAQLDGKPAPTPAPKEAAPAKPDAPKPEEKKTAAATDKPKAKGLNALPNISEAEKVEAKPEGEQTKPEAVTEQPPAGLKPEAQTRWGELRRAETELKTIKPQYEALQKELQALKEKPPLPENISKELEDHRQWRAAFDWQGSEEYQKAVAEPMAKQWSLVQETIDYLGVDANKLATAMQETNRLRRIDAIKAVLGESEKEIDPVTVTDIANAAGQLHEINAKAEELKAKALDMQNAMKGRREQETQAQKQAREETFNKAADETFRALGTRLGEFLSDAEVAESVKSARIAEDPMDQAYQAQAGIILPNVVQALIDARKELATLKKQAQARNAAKPDTKGHSAEPPNGERALSLQDAIAAQYPTRAA